MIYTDHWAFMHIPKTGGVNFKKRTPKHMVRGRYHIPKNSQVTPQARWWHQPISYHLKHIPHLKNLPWISIVRHPEDRLASWFYFIKKVYKPDWEMSFEEFVIENRIKDFSLSPAQKIFNSEGGSWKLEDLQSNWFHVPDGVNLTYFRLEDQLDILESYVGFKFSNTKYNSSNSNPYYTDEMKQITYITYQKDYENFGYEIR
jgi:hypothetical protein